MPGLETPVRFETLGVRGQGFGLNQDPLVSNYEKPSPRVLYSPSTKKLSVNGAVFDEDDASSALQVAEQGYLDATPAEPEPGIASDWIDIGKRAFDGHVNSIRNPSLKRLAWKNFGLGVDSLQLLAGRGLQLATNDKIGGGIVERNAQELYKKQPFQRRFTEIDGAGGAIEWFIANLAQQGPLLLETVAVALAGAAVGTTATGNPLVGTFAAFAGVFGKAAFKKKVVEAAAKRATLGKAALNKAEKRILQAAAAGTATAANAYAIGAADVYGELRDTGSSPDDGVARLTAVLAGIPHGALSLVPEYVLGARILLPGIKNILTKGGLSRRAATGLVVGGGLEGGSETLQEAILITAGKSLNKYNYSDEELTRLIDSFAAGFGIGGPIGGLANLRGRSEPVDLLDSAEDPIPQPSDSPTGAQEDADNVIDITEYHEVDEQAEEQSELERQSVEEAEVRAGAEAEVRAEAQSFEEEIAQGQSERSQQELNDELSVVERQVHAEVLIDQGEAEVDGAEVVDDSVAPLDLPLQPDGALVTFGKKKGSKKKITRKTTAKTSAAKNKTIRRKSTNNKVSLEQRAFEQKYIDFYQTEPNFRAVLDQDPESVDFIYYGETINELYKKLSDMTDAQLLEAHKAESKKSVKPNPIIFSDRKRSVTVPKSITTLKSKHNLKAIIAEMRRRPSFNESFSRGTNIKPGKKISKKKTSSQKPADKKTTKNKTIRKKAASKKVASNKPPIKKPAQTEPKVKEDKETELQRAVDNYIKDPNTKRVMDQNSGTEDFIYYGAVIDRAFKKLSDMTDDNLVEAHKRETMRIKAPTKLIFSGITLPDSISTLINRRNLSELIEEMHRRPSFNEWFDRGTSLESLYSWYKSGAKTQPAASLKTPKTIKKKTSEKESTTSETKEEPIVEVHPSIENVKMYHGQKTGAALRSISRLHLGLHVGTRKAAEARTELIDTSGAKVAPDGSRVHEVWITIKNPLVMDDLSLWDGKNIKVKLLETKVVSDSDIGRFADVNGKLTNAAAVNLIKSKGFDGIAYKNAHEDKGNYSYIVFDKSQISTSDKKKVTARPKAAPEESVKQDKGLGKKRAPKKAPSKADIAELTDSDLNERIAELQAIASGVKGTKKAPDVVSQSRSIQNKNTVKEKSNVDDEPTSRLTTEQQQELDDLLAELHSRNTIKEKDNADKKRETTTVPEGKQPGSTEETGSGDKSGSTVAGKSDASKSGGEETKSEVGEQKAQKTTPFQETGEANVARVNRLTAKGDIGADTFDVFKPEGEAAGLGGLPPAAQAEWERAHGTKGANLDITLWQLSEKLVTAAKEANKLVVTESDRVNFAIETAKEFGEYAASSDLFADAAYFLMGVAYFDPDANYKKGKDGDSMRERAVAYFNNFKTFGKDAQTVTREMFMELVVGPKILVATTKKADGTVIEAQWLLAAKLMSNDTQGNELVLFINSKVDSIKSKPQWVIDIIEQYEALLTQNQKEAQGKENILESSIRDAESILEMIDDIRMDSITIPESKRSADVNKINKLFKTAKKDYPISEEEKQIPLRNYFNNGKLKFEKIAGKWLPVTTTHHKDVIALLQAEMLEAEILQAIRTRAAADSLKRTKAKNKKAILVDYAGDFDKEVLPANTNEKSIEKLTTEEAKNLTGGFVRSDGTPITKKMSIGRIKILANKFINKLKVSPNVSVFRNAAHLKKSNPELHAKMAAGRKGDFDSTNAAGYNLGAQIIIFSDFIKTEHHLKFVIAHETLGHFGMRSLVNPRELNIILNDIHDSDSHVQYLTDINMLKGMSKMEAIEEVLSDRAATLDSSVILRIWTAIKNALNKLGLVFDDDMARYFIGQARRYVKEGSVKKFNPKGAIRLVDGRSIATLLNEMELEHKSGRFSSDQETNNLASRAFISASFNRIKSGFSGFDSIRNATKSDLWKSALNTKKGIDNIAIRALEIFQTMNHKANKSDGGTQMFDVLQEQRKQVSNMLSDSDDLAQKTHALFDGLSSENKKVVNDMIAWSAIHKANALVDKDIIKHPDLFDKLPNGEVVANKSNIDGAFNKGFVTLEMFNNGLVYKDPLGKTHTKKFNIEEGSSVWIIYKEQRNLVKLLAVELLLSNYVREIEGQKATINSFDKLKLTNGTFSEADKAIFHEIAGIYFKLQTTNITNVDGFITRIESDTKKAELFLREIQRGLHIKLKKDDWINNTPGEDINNFQGPEYQNIINAMNRLYSLGISENIAYEIKNSISDIFLKKMQLLNAEFFAKKTLLGSYTSFVREGKYQIVTKAYNIKGENVRLHPNYQDAMPYLQHNSLDAADKISDSIDKLFGGVKDSDGKAIEHWTVKDINNDKVNVTFRAERSKTSGNPPIVEGINYNDFIDLLEVLGVKLAIDDREKIVTNLTHHHSLARKNLQRSVTPGWDPDMLRALAQWAETQAHIIGKNYHRDKLTKLLVDDSLWRGDWDKLKKLKDGLGKASNAAHLKILQQRYDRYAFMMINSADSQKGRRVELGGKWHETKGRGEEFRDDAKNLIHWYSKSINILDSFEDTFSSEAGSVTKLATVLMYLGGVFASGFINMTSMATNTEPYLSSYNPKTGYGGGFGFGNSSAEISKAIIDVGHTRFASTIELEKMLKNGLYKQFGLEYDEVKLLRTGARGGVLDAAQYIALVGTARGGVKSNRSAKAIEYWMWMFTYTERLNRRATALATFRLTKRRAIAAGYNEKDAYNLAETEAFKAVDATQGNYTMTARPNFARGNILQYVMIFKTFTINSLLMFHYMDWKGKLAFMGMLLLMSGLKGLPYAEDLSDLLDTLLPIAGVKIGSVQKWLVEAIDDIAPGMSPIAMRGVLDQITGSTLSSRISFGDVFPMTGAMLPGSDPWRETNTFLGPVFSGITGLIATASDVVRYGAESIGLKDDTTSIRTIMRNSPIVALRAMTDAYSYMADGVITNTEGKLVSEKVNLGVILGRMLGFYPSIATRQNDIVRMAKQSASYVKEVKMNFIAAYVRAHIQKNNEDKTKILRIVREWNKAANGTEFEMRGFKFSAIRAAREASRPTILRYQRSAPTLYKEEIEYLLKIYGLENEL